MANTIPLIDIDEDTWGDTISLINLTITELNNLDYGDVSGPASSTDGVMALFDGATGKLLKVGSAPFSGSYNDLADKPTIPSGTVTSIGLSVPTGFSVANSPITTSGSFTISYQSGYQGYTTAEANKLSGIETNADVTDATNVASAGAIMDGDFSANGIMVRTAAGTYTSRTIADGTGITVTDGNGVSNNPSIALSSATISTLDKADTAVQPGDLGDLAVKDQVGVADLNTSGTANTTTYLRGDMSWQEVASGGGQVDSVQQGTGITVNSADPTSPIVNLSTATQTSLGKADTAVQPGSLGNSATLDVGTTAGTVAAGDHSHSAATTGAPGFMSADDKTKLNGITAGADVTNSTTVTAAGAIMDGDFSSNGLMARTNSGSYTSRTITQGSGIVVSNGNGVSGNPTISANTGTTTGTLAAGDDSRITGAIQSSLLTTRGDIIIRNASAPARLAKGTTGAFLVAGSNEPEWIKYQRPAIITKSTNQTTTSTTFQQLSGFSATITPQSTSHRIKITVFLKGEAWSGVNDQNSILEAQIRRGTSSADVVGSGAMGIWLNVDDNLVYSPVVMHAIDSPNTTSAVTYYVYFRRQGNGQVQVYEGSTMIVEEIGPA